MSWYGSRQWIRCRLIPSNLDFSKCMQFVNLLHCTSCLLYLFILKLLSEIWVTEYNLLTEFSLFVKQIVLDYNWRSYKISLKNYKNLITKLPTNNNNTFSLSRSSSPLYYHWKCLVNVVCLYGFVSWLLTQKGEKLAQCVLIVRD